MRTFLFLLTILLSPSASAAQIAPAVGLDDPVLALNLGPMSPHSPQRPFLDLMLGRAGWILITDEGKRRRKTDADAALQDAGGWYRRMPENVASLNLNWQWPSGGPDERLRKGDYRLTWEGSGEVSFKGNIKVIEKRPGLIRFTNRNGRSMHIVLSAIDPSDHPRDFSLIREDQIDLANAGAIFTPEWIEILKDTREIRFMNWMLSPGKRQRKWENRTKPGTGPWSQNGAPVEVMVRLANQIGADPWFNMPIEADADYHRQFATYVRDHLDPGLRASFEYSNETWNPGLLTGKQLRAQMGAGFDEYDIDAYMVEAATKAALIWREVFADQPERLRTMLAGQTNYFGRTKSILNTRQWRRLAPNGFKISDVFDAYALSSYFGSHKPFREEFVAGIDEPEGVNRLTNQLL
ncbi:MAG: hypothetical protein AAF401_15930, partial [Pseudomonadota bacterium]